MNCEVNACVFAKALAKIYYIILKLVIPLRKLARVSTK